MTALLFASSATAYVFSGMICYLLSIGSGKEYRQEYKSINPTLVKALVRLWVTALWPIWIIGEITGEEGIAETLAVNPISCSDSEVSLVEESQFSNQ